MDEEALEAAIAREEASLAAALGGGGGGSGHGEPCAWMAPAGGTPVLCSCSVAFVRQAGQDSKALIQRSSFQYRRGQRTSGRCRQPARGRHRAARARHASLHPAL